MPPRPPVLLLVLAAVGVLILPALYTHHRDPTYIPSLFQTSLPAHIVVPSGGNNDLPMTLEARLTDLLARPALEQWETELASRHGCPFYTYSRNTYFFHTEDKVKLWEGISKSDIRRYRSKMVEYLRNVEREGQKLVWEKGMDDHVPLDKRRGLIFTGGKGKTIERLKLSLHMLRNVIGSTIPVELYHYPDEMEDEAVKKELVDKYDVTIRAIGQRVGSDENWVIKNEAFIATDFTEFVYLDSDNIPLRDPEELFDSVEYKNSGSVFWSDLNKDHPDNAIFRIMGRYCSDEHWPAETGQMLFDKRGNNGLNLAILHLANHMMKERDMYYFLSYGDKDTFRYAHYALGLDYQMNSHQFATAGGYQDGQGQDTPTSFCGHSLIQWGLTPQSMVNDKNYHPEPFFLHTILAKHKQNLQPSKLFSNVRKPRLDRINEPLLVRTLYEFSGQCFDINLKGPDGHADTENGMGDGQGVVVLNTKDVVGAKAWKGLQEISEQFVAI